VRVVVADAPAGPERKEAIEIALNGARVRVRAGVDRATLATAIVVLDERGRPGSRAGSTSTSASSRSTCAGVSTGCAATSSPSASEGGSAAARPSSFTGGAAAR
jgi:hypothetical protein